MNDEEIKTLKIQLVLTFVVGVIVIILSKLGPIIGPILWNQAIQQAK